ncbi:MAG TPA: ABC transporter permease, partial [Flavisolibacter sp.]|nr:ABC transporter permease [Flavisolibacter sp.]
MFRNYLKTALRNLLRYKGFAFINILSLTIGIMGCLVIALFVWDEKQYDKFVPGGANIYRIYEERNNNGVITHNASVPPAYATFLKEEYPEVAVTARILMIGDKFLLENGDRKGYEDQGRIVDSNFFQVFPVKFLSGDLNTALNDPSSLVISEDLAKRYFGNEDPLGKTMQVNKSPLIVRGVFAKLPEHFHLQFQYLMPMASAGLPKERMGLWTWHQFYTYLKLKPGTTINQLQNKFQAHIKKDIFPTLTQVGSTFLPFFQPLKDVHLKSSDFIYDIAIRGNNTYVNALSI